MKIKFFMYILQVNLTYAKTLSKLRSGFYCSIFKDVGQIFTVAFFFRCRSDFYCSNFFDVGQDFLSKNAKSCKILIVLREARCTLQPSMDEMCNITYH